jgi:hypothetical protein
MGRVFVPEENLLPGVSGLKGPFTCLDSARYTYEGTHDVHALILGRAQTGIAAF